ncbi:hypothetical protein M4D55_08205 [Metabacillus idriensis]|uniref:DUF7852 domain-containing protein n=1 Tax=Metabacillus idriensis TaxID=324768 RepID=A0A6I2M986_9BACI|nr:hypothetical protein [Metabacillus idriensis]MCM3595761.1 hypothetical protein [Metabacillus idriensis]MRX53872.1 hypothetical protein [Metabacillus idriensis]
MSVEPFPRSTSMQHCKATIVDPSATPSTGIIIKVPVLLQEVRIEIPVHAKITFPKGEKVLEIKEIKKRVFLTQCRLINREYATSGQLFLSGFVRKNIQYASNPKEECKGSVSSVIKSLTVEVPFDCVAEIERFLTPPVGPVSDSKEEFGFFIAQPLGIGFPEKDQLLSTDISQFHQISTEHFNELPFCELVKADIIEFDEALNRSIKKEECKCDESCDKREIILEIPLEEYIELCSEEDGCECEECKNKNEFKHSSSSKRNSFKELSDKLSMEIIAYEEDFEKKHVKKDHRKKDAKIETFTELSEKMILDITLKLLQRQQIRIG